MNEKEMYFVDINKFVETNLLERPRTCFQCEICLKTFTGKQELEKHTSEVCEVCEDPSSAPLELKCDVCREFFSSERSFRAHIRSHQIESSSVSNSEDIEALRCSVCDKSYKTNLRIQRNSGKIHLPKALVCPSCKPKRNQLNERPFSCDHCGKKFKLKQQLQCHLLTHEDYRPFPCDKCEKSFKLKQQLQNHTATHLDLKPFQCNLCDKSFRLKQQLEVHYRVHTKLKPYQCRECGKTFSLKQNLNVHHLKHTASKPFQCGECGKGFVTKQNLTVHAKVHQRRV